MREIGGKLRKSSKGTLQSLQHFVEGTCQWLKVRRPFAWVEMLTQMSRGNSRERLGHLSKRAQSATGDAAGAGQMLGNMVQQFVGDLLKQDFKKMAHLLSDAAGGGGQCAAGAGGAGSAGAAGGGGDPAASAADSFE